MEKDESKSNIEKIEFSKKVYDLIDTLKHSKDWRARERAAKDLGNMRDKRAVEPLIRALRDKSWEVRRRAAEALGKIRDERAVGPLIWLLKDKNRRIIESVALALREIGSYRTLEPLIYMLKDRDYKVRENAAYTFGVLKNIRWVVYLKLALKYEDEDDVRRMIEWALSQMGYKEESDKKIELPTYTKKIRKREDQVPEMLPYNPSNCQKHEYVTLNTSYDFRDSRCVIRRCKNCGHTIRETTK